MFPDEGSEGLRCGIGKRYPASPDDIPALRAGTISEPAAQTISACADGGGGEAISGAVSECGISTEKSVECAASMLM